MYDPWPAPNRQVAEGRSAGVDGQDEFDILSGQRGKVNIKARYSTLIALQEHRQCLDGAVIDLVIQLENDIALSSRILATGKCLEAIAAPDGKGRVNTLDHPIRDFVWSNQESGWADSTVFKLWVGELVYEALCISIRTRARQDPCSTDPDGRAEVRRKII